MVNNYVCMVIQIPMFVCSCQSLQDFKLRLGGYRKSEPTFGLECYVCTESEGRCNNTLFNEMLLKPPSTQISS